MGKTAASGTYNGSHLLVRLQNVRNRSHGHDAKWVQRKVARHVMFLDMLELRRLLKGGHVPVQISEPAVDGRIAAAYVADVAFKVRHVDGIEADGGHVQAHVRFGEVFAEVVRSLGRCGHELGLDFVEVGEEVGHSSIVCFLRTGGSGLARRLSGRTSS